MTYFLQAVFVVHVEDVNEPPTTIHFPDKAIVREDASMNEKVTQIIVDDPDYSFADFTCQVQDDKQIFLILQRGSEIRLVVGNSSGLDYESAAEINVTVACTDGTFNLSKVKEASVQYTFHVSLRCIHCLV